MFSFLSFFFDEGPSNVIVLKLVWGRFVLRQPGTVGDARQVVQQPCFWSENWLSFHRKFHSYY